MTDVILTSPSNCWSSSSSPSRESTISGSASATTQCCSRPLPHRLPEDHARYDPGLPKRPEYPASPALSSCLAVSYLLFAPHILERSCSVLTRRQPTQLAHGSHRVPLSASNRSAALGVRPDS